MTKYEGICVGGPLDGQRLVHGSMCYEFSREPSPREPWVILCEYNLNDISQWEWRIIEAVCGCAEDINVEQFRAAIE